MLYICLHDTCMKKLHIYPVAVLYIFTKFTRCFLVALVVFYRTVYSNLQLLTTLKVHFLLHLYK